MVVRYLKFNEASQSGNNRFIIENGLRSLQCSEKELFEFKDYLNKFITEIKEIGEYPLSPDECFKTNSRGFSHVKFKDTYGEVCSIQESSAAMQNCIWLGIDNPKLVVFQDETKGKYLETKMPENFSVNCRMHLSIEQAKQILPLLQSFVDTGFLTTKKEE